MLLQPLAPGDPARVGPHRLLARLGQGGMGTVFLALTPEDRVVAVKVLRDGPSDVEGRRRFRRELEVLQRVRGPHLVEVLGGDAEAATPWLVTRFVPGRRLDDVVLEGGPLPEGGLLRVALGIAQGLRALHAAGVVHRDLTPGNVLLVDGEPHVIDLGLAVVADVTALTRSGLVVGTAGYLAPEQVLGHPSGPAADVHAWAATLALAATGRPPFGTGRPEAVLYRVVHSEPDLEGVPALLAPLVAAALDKDPAGRPLDDELVTQLTALSTRAHDLVGASSGPHRVLGPERDALLGPGGVLGPPATEILGREVTALLRDAAQLPAPRGRSVAGAGATTVLGGAGDGAVDQTAVLGRAGAGPDQTAVLGRAGAVPVDQTAVLGRPGAGPDQTAVLGRSFAGPVDQTAVLGRAGSVPLDRAETAVLRHSAAGPADLVAPSGAGPVPGSSSAGDRGPLTTPVLWGPAPLTTTRPPVSAPSWPGAPAPPPRWGPSDVSASAGGELPPDPAAADVRAGRLQLWLMGLPAALLLGVAALVAPVVVALAAAVGLLVVQAGVHASAHRRRLVEQRGPRRRDGAVAVLGLPVRLLASAIDLVCGIPLLLVGAGLPAYAVQTAVGDQDGVTAAAATATVLGVLLTLVRRPYAEARTRLSRASRLVAVGPGDAFLAGAVLLVAALVLAGAAHAGPHWWPGTQPPATCVPLLRC